MKERKISVRKRKTFGRIICVAVAALLSVCWLTGCSRERAETRREIERIKKAAESVAEDRAAAYISEKYGIEAVAGGYWEQAYNDFFAPYVSTNVVVFMEYGDRKFCVGIDVDDETVLWDNYQRAEIDAALQEYFTELYELPRVYRAETVFRLEDAPNYHVATPAEWREKGYDHANMVDFYFRGQSAEELLARIEYLEFYDSWLSMDKSLDSISFNAKDWPVCAGGYIEWNLRLYASPEAEFVDVSTESPDIGGFPYFREWRRVCLRDRGTEGEALSGESWRFHSVQADGITVTSRLPFEKEDILRVSVGEEVWSVDRGSSGIQKYRLVSDVYEVTEKSPDSSYATVMHVSADFVNQHEGSFYILSRSIEGNSMEEEHSMETGKVKIVKYIFSQEELDALPEDESRREYKIYSNGTCGMSAGYQYVVAEKIEDERE